MSVGRGSKRRGGATERERRASPTYQIQPPRRRLKDMSDKNPYLNFKTLDPEIHGEVFSLGPKTLRSYDYSRSSPGGRRPCGRIADFVKTGTPRPSCHGILCGGMSCSPDVLIYTRARWAAKRPTTSVEEVNSPALESDGRTHVIIIKFLS
jgi:hypothetical protein